MQYPAIKIGEKGMAIMATLSPTGAGFVFAQSTWTLTNTTNSTNNNMNNNEDDLGTDTNSCNNKNDNNNFGESVDDTPRL